ncbi:uncharacterized protein LOC143853971 [Tasmannia lanceolata]|uniref:uncharacterized protein LOC143853971 n=1 Tax=Tasmannia lanceolata TaxID=3420 RepID=UPI0040646044
MENTPRIEDPNIRTPAMATSSQPRQAASSSLSSVDASFPPITTSRLDGSNYLTWKIAVETYLKSMTPAIASTMMDLPTAKKVWEHTAALYSGEGNVARLCDTYSRWMGHRRSDSTVHDYYRQFVSYCQQLDARMPLTTDLTTAARQRDQLRVIHFLEGLRPEFTHLRQHILGSGTVPTLHEVFLQAQQCALGITVPTPVDVSTTAAYGAADRPSRRGGTFGRDRGCDTSRGGRGGGREGGRGGRARPYCTHCRREGHYHETCFDLHPELRHTPDPRQGRIAHLALPDSPAPIDSPSQTPLATPTDQMVVSRADYDELQRFRSASRPPTASLVQPSSSPASFLSSSSSWIIDSGASHHMTGTQSSLHDFHHVVLRSITLADGSTSPITGDLSTGRTIGSGRKVDGLYRLDCTPSHPILHGSVDAYQWHCRLGHSSMERFRRIPFVSSLSVRSFQCEACDLGKHHRVPFPPRTVSRASHPFALVHSDVWGPARTISLFGFLYFVVFIDDYSRMTWTYLIKDLSEVVSVFLDFYTEVSNQFSCVIQCLRIDNAKEYFSYSNDFQEFLSSRGILHQSSCAHTSQQNGVAKRKLRSLLDGARTLLFRCGSLRLIGLMLYSQHATWRIGFPLRSLVAPLRSRFSVLPLTISLLHLEFLVVSV